MILFGIICFEEYVLCVFLVDVYVYYVMVWVKV